MPPFRPANLNKRAYPGNASVIGPTCTATVGFTTSNVGFTTTPSCGAAGGPNNVLGCRFTHCCCPFCNIVCACSQTLCDRTIPSGRWKTSEQYEARTRDSWGDDTCTICSPTCLCCIDVGTCLGPQCIDCKGFFICCGPSTNKWFVAPSCTEVNRSWYSKDDVLTLTNSCQGCCGWFVPTFCQLNNPGFCCRSYWDSYSATCYWSNTRLGGSYANVSSEWQDFTDGSTGGHFSQKTNDNEYKIRAFRCV